MKHGNLSIFVPHVGCPKQCSFCNQRAISGTIEAPRAKDVTALCEKYLPTNSITEERHVEIAFFGGSFTAISKAYMEELLGAAFPYVLNGRAKGIRISTRPDAIDESILHLLKQYRVTAIELGAQSMLDDILVKNSRGHLSRDVEYAASLIKAQGFSLGLQMMVGLPFEKNAAQAAAQTAVRLAALKPDTMRIYPAITLKGTQMQQWYEAGSYAPIPLEEAVDISAKLIAFFEKRNIKVIRVGLHADESLEENYVAGPYHPAFRQLCESQQYKRALQAVLEGKKPKAYTVKVAKGEISTAKGQKKRNVIFFEARGYTLHFAEQGDLRKGQFIIH